MDPGGFGQAHRSPGSGSEDVIAVRGQAHHGGIDCVGGNAAGQQHPRPAAQDVIDRGDIGPDEQPGQRRLPASVAASVRPPQASQLASLPGDAKFPGHARPVGLMQAFRPMSAQGRLRDEGRNGSPGWSESESRPSPLRRCGFAQAARAGASDA